jgi:K+-transporting ATPase ATPase C chain
MTFRDLRQPLVLFILLTAVTGVFYPLLITGLAQILFPRQANGSLIVSGTRTVGSELIGQQCTDPRYFWSRPSATAPFPYTADASSGSNLGPLNPKLLDDVQGRVRFLTMADPIAPKAVPVDLVTSSGSGLDPHISVMAALYQVSRVARARNLSEEQVRALIRQDTEGRQFGVLGEPRVNVLRLNIALDRAGSPEASR